MSYSMSVPVDKVEMSVLLAILMNITAVRFNIGTQAVGLVKARKEVVENEVRRRIKSNTYKIAPIAEVKEKLELIQGIEAQEKSEERDERALYMKKHNHFAKLDMLRGTSQLRSKMTNSFGIRALLNDVLAIPST